MRLADFFVIVVFVAQLCAVAWVAASVLPMVRRGKRTALAAKLRKDRLVETAAVVVDSSRAIVAHGKAIETHAKHVAKSIEFEDPPGFLVTPRSIRRSIQTVRDVRRTFSDRSSESPNRHGSPIRVLERFGLIPPLLLRLLPAFRSGAKLAKIARNVSSPGH